MQLLTAALRCSSHAAGPAMTTDALADVITTSTSAAALGDEVTSRVLRHTFGTESPAVASTS
jgi:site-specific recombinase XerD